jgi:hypothetical protein
MEKLVGLTTRLGVPQLHCTTTVFAPCPEKLQLALLGQDVFGMVTVTWAVCPGDNVPLDGLKVVPFISPDADHLSNPWAF